MDAPGRGPAAPMILTLALALGLTPAFALGLGPAPAAAQAGEGAADGESPPLAAATAPLPPERELNVRLERLGTEAGQLVVDLVLEHLLDSATEDVLERGVPVTLLCEVEVWRERSAWFDRLDAVRAVSYKLQWDAWDEVYVLRGDGREEIFVDLGEALTALERRPAVPIAPLDLLTDGDTYYLVVNAALKPLTVEDVDELEGWLSGEIKSGRQRGLGIVGLPKALYGLLKNVTGFGDRNDTLRTARFRKRDLLTADASGP
jgi:hypothetical protein